MLVLLSQGGEEGSLAPDEAAPCVVVELRIRGDVQFLPASGRVEFPSVALQISEATCTVYLLSANRAQIGAMSWPHFALLTGLTSQGSPIPGCGCTLYLDPWFPPLRCPPFNLRPNRPSSSFGSTSFATRDKLRCQQPASPLELKDTNTPP